MAIKIPSKHIYDISFNPVIDNVIDKIEGSINKSSIILNEQAVNIDPLKPPTVNETHNFNTLEAKTIAQYYDGYYKAQVYMGQVFVQLMPTYLSFNVNIPIEQGNSYIKEVITGYSQSSSPNIRATIIGEKNIGTATATNTLESWKGKDNFKLSTPTDIDIDVTETLNDQYITFTQADCTLTATKEFYEYPNSLVDEQLVTAKVTFTNKENLGTVVAEKITLDNKPYWHLYCTVLYRLRKTILSNDKNYELIYVGDSYTLSGTYEEQKGKTIKLDIDGRAYIVDLQDTAFMLGDGNNVYMFEGNELIQDTNTPSLKEKYQTIIDQWQNGKQSCVISCPVVDFYDTDGNKVVDINADDKMLIHIGDIVEPYVFTNKGDRPLSYNKDFTPKQFEVIGTEISTKQGITQKLTLLEYVNKITQIYIIGSVSSDSSIGIQTNEVTLESGEIEIGDTLIYDNEEAEVTGYDAAENLWYIDIPYNGIIAQQEGNTITVKVIKSD